MKAINQVVITCLIITICACVNVAAQTTEPPVSWFDDFLGINLHPGYAKSLSGTGHIDMSSSASIGGVVMLWAESTAAGVARLRFGEAFPAGVVDVRNFSAAKNVVYKARVS